MLNTIKLKIKTYLSKKYFKENKKKSIAFIIILIALIYGIKILFFPTVVENRYAIGNVVKGDIVSTISSSGQVSATNQIEIKSKNSGPLTKVSVVTGQEVKAGTVIAQIDNRDAWYAYQNANISYKKLIKPADAVSTIQAENNLDQAKNSVNSYYAEAISNIDNVFIDMPKIIDGLNTMYYTNSGTLNNVDETSLPTMARTYKAEAGLNFDKSRKEFENNFSYYKTHSGKSSNEETKKLIDITYNNVVSMTQAVKGVKNTLDYLQSSGNTSGIKDMSASQTNVNNWLNQLNSHLTKLVNVKNNISLSEKTIIEKQTSLIDVNDGADYLDIQSAKLSLDQKWLAYSDSFIKAPFDGVIAKVDVKKGDEVSSGTAIATIITKQKIVSVDLNEVDISKVKVGQNTNITFDAIDGLTATGTVVSVDGIGTVTQGVVSYNVQIALNTKDDRILSGMSSSVIIDVDTKKDVITAPTSAIKIQGNRSYVEVVSGTNDDVKGPIEIDANNIKRVFVELGLSDDDKTEIISGLNEGEKIIIRTITSAGAKTTNSSGAPSLLGGQGTRPAGGAGNFNRTR